MIAYKIPQTGPLDKVFGELRRLYRFIFVTKPDVLGQ